MHLYFNPCVFRLLAGRQMILNRLLNCTVPGNTCYIVICHVSYVCYIQSW